MVLMKKNKLIVTMIISIFVISLFCLTSDSQESQMLDNEAVVVHEDLNNITHVELGTEDYDLIKSIEDHERRALIEEYWYTPVSSEVISVRGDGRKYKGNASLTRSQQFVPNNEILDLIEMPMDELKVKVEDVRKKNIVFQNNDK